MGIYTAEVYCPLYTTWSVADIIVKSNKITFISIELKLDFDMNEHQEITVSAGYFKDSQNEPASLISFSNEEIRRAAGSGGDISRVVSGLPSISRVNDQKNSLIVRGGSPAEIGFFVNNIEIPNINHYRMQNIHSIHFGVEEKYISSHFDCTLGEDYDVLGNLIPEFKDNREIYSSSGAVFFNYVWDASSRFSFDLGIRTDYFSLNKSLNFSPRIGITYKLTDRTSVSSSAGLFHQRLPMALLLQNKSHQELKNPISYHYVVGYQHIMNKNTRFTLEVYSKEYKNLPLDPLQPALFVMDESNQTGYFSHHEILFDSGRARSYGLEIMLQKKLAEKLYGLVSGSYFRSSYKGLDGKRRNRVYDNRFIITVEGGYRFNPSWEFGLKWHLAGGAPFTPFDHKLSTAANEGIYDSDKINGDRQPAYHSLNLRIDRRFFFRASNLTIYFSIWNVYNQRNLAFYFWNSLENRMEREDQWGLLPVLGVEFEF